MPETPEDAMPPQPATAEATEVYPRVRAEATRLDARSLFEVGDPTRVQVSPIGTHTPTRRYAPGGPVDVVNRLLDERERAEDRRNGRAAAQTARTVREEAQRRAAAKERHERRMEHLEEVRAWLSIITVFCLLVVVIGAGVVGWGILDGWFAWQPVHVTGP